MPEAADGASRAALVRQTLAALGSALLARATMPPFDLAPLALVAWVPLLALVGQVRLRALLAAATLQGITLNLAAHGWVMSGLEQAIDAPGWAGAGAWIALAIVQGLRTPLVFALVHLAVRHRCPLWLAFGALQVLVEAVYPLLFPWTLALQVHGVTAWLQLAAGGGPALVSLWVGLANGLLAEAWQRRRRRGAAAAFAGAAALLLAGVTLFGQAAIARAEAREAKAPEARLLVGHAVTAVDQRRPEPVPELRRQTLSRLSDDPAVDLVIWPETVVGWPTPSLDIPKLARDYLLRDRALGTRAPVLRVPLLVGLVAEEDTGLYNSAALVRHPGVLLGRYDKRRLIPVGESDRLAPSLSGLGELLPVATRFTSGSARDPISIGGHRLAVSICYEDILPELIQKSVLATDPELLVNLTSDAWFRGTDAVDFHLALSKLRAVEHAKYLVRSTRDGAAAVIDSAGRVRARVDGAPSRAFRATVRWLPGFTPYAIHGSIWLLALLPLLGLTSLARTGFISRAVRRVLRGVEADR